MVWSVASSWRRSSCSARRYTNKQSTITKRKRNHTPRLLDEHGGSQKQRVFEKTKPPLHASLLFIRPDHLFMRKALLIQDVGGYNEGRFLSGQSRHFVLIYREGGDQIPRRLLCSGLFVRATTLLILLLCFEGKGGKQPGWFSFERLFPGSLRICLASKRLLGEVPEAFFPLLLGFLHLFL